MLLVTDAIVEQLSDKVIYLLSDIELQLFKVTTSGKQQKSKLILTVPRLKIPSGSCDWVNEEVVSGEYLKHL